jgi:hypothetical protein
MAVVLGLLCSGGIEWWRDQRSRRGDDAAAGEASRTNAVARATGA